jgi:hypothetical protein
MESLTYRRAEPTRARRVHNRSRRVRLLRAAVAVGAMVAVTVPVLSSDAAVAGRRSIEVTTSSDLVILSGYPSRAQVKVQVLRKGVVVGFATKRTTRAGALELNHSGRAAGDCFESPNTPNIRPGDRVRTTILSNGVRDFTVVRNVVITGVEFGATSITVTGHVGQGAGAAAVDLARDVLELRINKETNWFGTGRSDLRETVGASVDPATGDFTHVIDGLNAADVNEAQGASDTVLEWSRGAAADELTIAEWAVPTARVPGCPPVETN